MKSSVFTGSKPKKAEDTARTRSPGHGYDDALRQIQTILDSTSDENGLQVFSSDMDGNRIEDVTDSPQAGTASKLNTTSKVPPHPPSTRALAQKPLAGSHAISIKAPAPVQTADLSSTRQARVPLRRSFHARARISQGDTSKLGHRKPLPNFITDPDNAGRAAWRRNEDAMYTFTLPKDFDVTHDSKTYGRSGTDPFPSVRKIAVETQAHILPANENGRIVFKCWGSREHLGDAKRRLETWAQQQLKERASGSTEKTKRSSAWAKVSPVTPKMQAKIEEGIEENNRREAFRKQPPASSVFRATGAFRWPEEDYRPEQILGMSFEAFDTLRMEYRCFIVYDRASKSFRVMSMQPEKVSAAVQRVRATVYQIVARELTAVKSYLIKPLTRDSDLLTEVQLRKHYPPRALLRAEAVFEFTPGLAGLPLARQALEMRKKLVENQSAAHNRRIKENILNVMLKLQYYRGMLKFRVRLGAFALKKWRKIDGNYEIGAFEDMIADPMFGGEVTEELSNIQAEQCLLPTLLGKDSKLVPKDPMSNHPDDVRPLYSAIFIIASPDNTEYYRLEIQYKDHDGNFDCTLRRWSKFERGARGPTKLLDVAVIDLAQSLSCSFGMLAMTPVEEARLPKEFSIWASKISIDPKSAMDHNGPGHFMNWPLSPYIVVKRVEQRLIWQLAFPQSDHVVEISRFRRSVSPDEHVSGPSTVAGTGTKPKAPDSLVPQIAQQVAFEPRWSLQMYCEDWDAVLSENASLPIGQGASWKPTLSTLFGNGSQEDNIDGFDIFMKRLTSVSDVVRSIM